MSENPHPFGQPGTPDPTNPYAVPTQPSVAQPYGAPPQGQPYAQQPQGQPYGVPPQGQPYAQQPQGQPGQMPQVVWSDKSKLAAGLLGIFLGAFGVHNFYLGNTTKAVTQLLITVLSIGILAVVSSVWGLIEAILILSSQPGTQWSRDAQGRELRPSGV